MFFIFIFSFQFLAAFIIRVCGWKLRVPGGLHRPNDSETISEKHSPCATTTASATKGTATTTTTTNTKPLTALNYTGRTAKTKMPPLNESSNGNGYAEAPIPGMTLMSDTQASVAAASLRTHSSKFPVRFWHADFEMTLF